MPGEIEKINRINGSRNPYALNKDRDELIYKRRMRAEHSERRAGFRKELNKRKEKELSGQKRKIKTHALYKNGKRIF